MGVGIFVNSSMPHPPLLHIASGLEPVEFCFGFYHTF